MQPVVPEASFIPCGQCFISMSLWLSMHFTSLENLRLRFFMMYGRNTNQFREIHDNKTEYAIIPRGDEWWNAYS